MSTSTAVTYYRTGRAPGEVADNEIVVREAVIPYVWWPDVTIKRTVSSDLSGLEQFVLETAVAFGKLDPIDFTALTSLPEELLRALARRLTRSGVLKPLDSGFKVVPEAAEAALASRAIPQEKQDTYDFLFLPGTNDLININKRHSSTLGSLQRSRSGRQTTLPAPPSLVGARKSVFLRNRIKERSICGLPGDVFDVVTPDDPADDRMFHYETIQVSRASAIVQKVTRGLAVELFLHGGTNSADGSSTGDTIQIHIPPTTRLANEWASVADSPAATINSYAFWHALVTPTVTARPAQSPTRRSLCRWDYPIDGSTAEALGALRRNLAVPFCVDIRTDDGAVLEAVVEFSATDARAKRLLTVDERIAASQRGESDPGPLRDLISANSSGESLLPKLISLESVMDRLWQLRDYQFTYELAEPRDFHYD